MRYNGYVIIIYEKGRLPHDMEFQFWEDYSGRCPVRDFLEALDGNTQEVIDLRFERFEKYSYFHLAKAKIVEKVQGYPGMYEVRMPVKKVEYRFLGSIKGGYIWLVHAFKKKSKKMPHRELKTAQIRIRNLL